MRISSLSVGKRVSTGDGRGVWAESSTVRRPAAAQLEVWDELARSFYVEPADERGFRIVLNRGRGPRRP